MNDSTGILTASAIRCHGNTASHKAKEPARRLSASTLHYWQHGNISRETLPAVQQCCAACISQMQQSTAICQNPPAPLNIPTAAHCQLLQHRRQTLTCAANTSQYCLSPSVHWLFSSCRDTKPAQMTISCSSSPQGMRCRACSRPVAAPCSVLRERLNLQGSGPQVPLQKPGDFRKGVWQVWTGPQASGGSTSCEGQPAERWWVPLSNAVAMVAGCWMLGEAAIHLQQNRQQYGRCKPVHRTTATITCLMHQVCRRQTSSAGCFSCRSTTP